MRIWSSQSKQSPSSLPSTLSFPTDGDVPAAESDNFDPGHLPSEFEAMPESAERIFDALDTMSRRLEDLARELNCLGYFDDDDDRPRAA